MQKASAGWSGLFFISCIRVWWIVAGQTCLSLAMTEAFVFNGFFGRSQFNLSLERRVQGGGEKMGVKKIKKG